MNPKAIRITVREAIVILAVLLIPYFFSRIGYVNMAVPFKTVDYRIVPKYSTASKDPSTVIFENNLIFLFRRIPSEKEIIDAYTGKNRSLVSKILCPDGSYESFWIFSLNPTFGFLDIDFNKLGRFILLFAYPLYWALRTIIWFVKALRDLNGHTA